MCIWELCSYVIYYSANSKDIASGRKFKVKGMKGIGSFQLPRQTVLQFFHPKNKWPNVKGVVASFGQETGESGCFTKVFKAKEALSVLSQGMRSSPGFRVALVPLQKSLVATNAKLCFPSW